MNKLALLKAFDDFIEKVEPAWQKFNDIADEYLPAVQEATEQALGLFEKDVRMGFLEGALKVQDPIGAEIAINFAGMEKKLMPVAKVLVETLMDGAEASVEDIFAVSRGAEGVTPAIEKHGSSDDPNYGRYHPGAAAPITVFHGTVSKYFNSINNKGIKFKPPQRTGDTEAWKELGVDWYEGENGQAVFVTKDFKAAKGMANFATEAYEERTGRSSIPIILRVELPQSIGAKLKQDENLAAGLKLIGQDIKPEWIKSSSREGNDGVWRGSRFRKADNTTLFMLALIDLLPPIEIEKADALLGVDVAAGLGISFEQAERWAAENAAIMVTAVTEQTKLGVRSIIARSINEGIVPKAAAREIRQIVGLTDRQANAVINFKRDLEDQMARGKSPFKTVPLTQERIDRMTEKFRKKHLKLRSEMIARTETIRSSNMGQQAIWEQAADRGLIDESVAVRRWVVTPDDRLCDFCRPMDGQIVPLRGLFESGTVELQRGGTRAFNPTLTPPLHPQCLVSYKTPIFTSKGWKQVGQIKVDDLVLTHKGRFRKVTKLIQTPKQTPTIVKIKLYGCATLTLTDNHPILIDGEWVEAKDAKPGQKIKYMAAKCVRCGKDIPMDNKYCSDRCCSLDITDRQWKSEEHRRLISAKTSAQLRREYSNGTRDGAAITKKAHEATREMAAEGKHPFQQDWVIEKNKLVTNLPQHRKASSERMKKNNPSLIPEVRKRMTESYKKTMLAHPEKHPNSIMAQKGFMSSLEKRMKIILDELGLEYVPQQPILNYFVDFGLPKYKVAIEVDGNYWHQDKEKDSVRQVKIEKEGWTVLRFSEDEMKDESLVKDEAKRILMNHNEEYSFVEVEITKVEKYQPTRKIKLFNFSVEEDESYIAKGFVVHNCRCAMVLDISPTGVIAGVDKPTPIATLPKKFSDFKNVRENLRSGSNVSRVAEFNDEEWFLKRPGDTEVISEIVSSKIGKYFGVNVPAVVSFKHRGDWWVATKSLKEKFPGARTARMFEKNVPEGIKFTSEISKNVGWQRMKLFDVFIGNEDRHLGNYMIVGSKGNINEIENILAIDHGLATFGEDIAVNVPAIFSSPSLRSRLTPDLLEMRSEIIVLLNNVTQELSDDWVSDIPEELLIDAFGVGGDLFDAGHFVFRAKTLLEILT